MTNHLRHILPFACLTLFCSSALAQEKVDPTKIQIPRPKRSTAWTITYTNPGEVSGPEDEKSQQADSRLIRENFIIGEPFSSAERIYASKRVAMVYQTEHYELLEHPKTREVIGFDLTNDASSSQLFRRVYPGFAWVTPAEYVDEADVEKEKCYHYKKNAMEAWLGEESGLPVAIKDGNTVGKYAFHAVPSEGVVVSAAFRAYLAKTFRNGPPPGQAASIGR